jgi:replication factor C large subunit
MEDWTEKYRPKSLREIAGNERAINALRNWALNWKSGVPKKRAVILSGKPGIGKTSSALALANEFEWTAVELNASDVRNASKIKSVVTLGATNETFDEKGRFTPSLRGGRKLIILDEADNLYEKDDRGGKRAIVDTIRISQQPIVLIVNDYYSLIKGQGESLKELCTLIQYYEVRPEQIFELLKRICREEKISADVRVLRTIADRCKGDVRSAIKDLQSICIDRKEIDLKYTEVLGYRDREKLIFDALRDIFKSRRIQSLNFENIDVPPETFLLWINENLPREYVDVEDLVNGYSALSKADLFFGRVSRRQYYGLWSYACDLMNCITIAKSHNYGNMVYNPPTWLKEMKSTKTVRSVRDSVIKKIGKLCHNSERKSKEFMLPLFKQIFRNNTRFAIKMRNKLELSENEIKYLLGEKYVHRLKEIMEKKEEEEDIEEARRQPSIFDF